jgi:predicted nucleotidyltransferase
VRDPREGVAPDGTITTGVARHRVPAAFEPVLDAVCAAAGPGAGVYLYGSVATGQARVGSSDVDVVTVGLDPVAAQRIGRELGERFRDVCREVAIGPTQPADYRRDDDRGYGDRVFLRHYCVHLAGPDQAAGLPPYPADARAARGFNGDIALTAARWRHDLAGGADPRRLGRRLARKTLMTAAGLVSVHDATWTTDRALGARRGDELLPGLTPTLSELLSWADGEVAPPAADVARALDGPVAAVTTSFATTIGLWEPPGT